MPLSIVDAVATIKRSVAQGLTSQAIEQACRAEQYGWRKRELGPAQTVHAFMLQVLHGNTAITHLRHLSDLERFTKRSSVYSGSLRPGTQAPAVAVLRKTPRGKDCGEQTAALSYAAESTGATRPPVLR